MPETELGDFIQLRGSIRMQLRDHDGNVIMEREERNLLVTAGRRFAIEQLASSLLITSRSISYAAVGTSTTAPATSDTALGNESSRIAINSFDTTNLTANPPSWAAYASWATNQANTTLGEVALLNSSSAGTMLNRATFATINKTTSNTLSLTYNVSG